MATKFPILPERILDILTMNRAFDERPAGHSPPSSSVDGNPRWEFMKS
jgi:hypothetical protein